MRLDIVTIFPEYFAPLDVSLLGKARQRGDVDVHVHDLRDWAHDRHRTVDDTPYGGGPGMVMKPEPWGEALDAIVPAGLAGRGWSCRRRAGARSPRRPAVAYAAEPWLVFACGRYEGIDARVIEDARSRMPVDEVSIGDYVLAGGESAVLVIDRGGRRGCCPACSATPTRSAMTPSRPGRMESLLEGPVYTKPPSWRGREVPEVLMSGNHGGHRPVAAGSGAAPYGRHETRADRTEPPGRRRPAYAGGGRFSDRRRTYGTLRCWPGFMLGTPRLPRRSHRVPALCACACVQHEEPAVMHTLIQEIENAAKRSDVPDFRPGDTLKVHVRVTEGSRSRIQVFQGVVIRRQGGGARETFTVRKVSYSVGVERTFPLNSPSIDKIEIVTRGDVRRAKLYYLRDLRGKAARIKEKRDN